MKPNFEAMSRKELIAYLLAHRDDREAFEMLIDIAPQPLRDVAPQRWRDRRSPDATATWYNFPETEEGWQQMKEVFDRRLNGEL